jgi:hypothetical protein
MSLGTLHETLEVYSSLWLFIKINASSRWGTFKV